MNTPATMALFLALGSARAEGVQDTAAANADTGGSEHVYVGGAGCDTTSGAAGALGLLAVFAARARPLRLVAGQETKLARRA